LSLSMLSGFIACVGFSFVDKPGALGTRFRVFTRVFLLWGNDLAVSLAKMRLHDHNLATGLCTYIGCLHSTYIREVPAVIMYLR
jgi:hypothetical protein